MPTVLEPPAVGSRHLGDRQSHGETEASVSAATESVSPSTRYLLSHAHSLAHALIEMVDPDDSGTLRDLRNPKAQPIVAGG